MKQLSTKQKIIYIVIIAIIIAGISVVSTIGFNLDVTYSNSKRIDIYIGKDFKISEIKEIGKEVFEDNFVVQTAQLTADEASITVHDASEEQIENFKNKVNEKYNVKEDLQNTSITNIPNIDIQNVITPYILPICIITLICTVYFAIRFRKQNILKVIAKTIFTVVIVEAVYFSLIAIIRIPFGEYIMPIAILVYIITLISMVYCFNRK